eukprot:4099281-Pyramimonas_sp.AAC.1
MSFQTPDPKRPAVLSAGTPSPPITFADLEGHGAIKARGKAKGKAKCKAKSKPRAEPAAGLKRKLASFKVHRGDKKKQVATAEDAADAAAVVTEFASQFHEFDLSEMKLPSMARPPAEVVGSFRGTQNYTVYAKSGAVINVLLKVKAFRILQNPLPSAPACPNFGWAKHGGVEQAWGTCSKACGFDVPIVSNSRAS